MSVNDLLSIELTEVEVRVLRHRLLEWGGPARCTALMAQAMGFESVADLFEQGDRLRAAIAKREPLSQRDWVRSLLATEIVFASDVMGSGHDWVVTCGLGDGETIEVLRGLQRKIPTAGSLDVILHTGN